MPDPKNIEEIRDYLVSRGLPDRFEAAVVLGSGLGEFAEEIRNKTVISYSDIPHFPRTSVAGHHGLLIAGTVAGKKVLAFSGRFHLYEGYRPEQTCLPVYAAHALNANKLILSNAAGGINIRYEPGDLMIIDSIIRLNYATAPFCREPFHGTFGTESTRIRNLAAGAGILVRQGTYLFVKGPGYETAAEIRAFRTMGADAVGMSTVPELTEACRLRLRTAAISVITNHATGMAAERHRHEEIRKTAASRKKDFSRLVSALIERY